MARIPVPGADWFSENDHLKFEFEDGVDVRRWWEKTFHRPIGITPGEIRDILTDGLARDEIVTFYAPRLRGASISIQVEGFDNSQIVYLAGQTLHLTRGSQRRINIDLADVVPSHQGRGINSALIDNVRRLAERVEVGRMTVDAYLEGGPYAWATYGFTPRKTDWLRIRGMMGAKLRELGDAVPDDVRARVERLLASDHPSAIQALITEDMKVMSAPPHITRKPARETTLAKALLADSGLRWYGALNLNDDLSMALFEEAVTRNRR